MMRDDMLIEWKYEDDDGTEFVERLPAKFEVCGRCRGHGSHVNPSIDGHGITADEWNGPDWDDDSREMYLSGGYDVSCFECNGKRVVKVVDEDACEPELLERYLDYLKEEEEFRRQIRHEKEMGY